MKTLSKITSLLLVAGNALAQFGPTTNTFWTTNAALPSGSYMLVTAPGPLTYNIPITIFNGYQPASANLTNWSGLATSAKQDADSDLTSIAALTTTSFGRGLLDDADASAVRTTIGAGTSSFSGAFSSLTGVPAPIVSVSTNNAATLTNVQPSNIAWSGISTAAFTNGVAARIPVYTNGGTIYYLTLSTNTP